MQVCDEDDSQLLPCQVLAQHIQDWPNHRPSCVCLGELAAAAIMSIVNSRSYSGKTQAIQQLSFMAMITWPVSLISALKSVNMIRLQ